MDELRRPARRLEGCEIEDGPDDRAAAADGSRTCSRASAVARVIGARPATAAMLRRSIWPSSGNSAMRVAATTGPTPAAVRSRRSMAASSGLAVTRSVIRASIFAIRRSNMAMTPRMSARAAGSAVCWRRVASCYASRQAGAGGSPAPGARGALAAAAGLERVLIGRPVRRACVHRHGRSCR